VNKLRAILASQKISDRMDTQ